MSLFKSTTSPFAGVNTDELLQDSYLLIIELRQGGRARSNNELWNLCAAQVQHVRDALQRAGFSQRSIDSISHAQCALLDETVFTCAEETAKETWAREPLQVRFFNRHQAGEFLYEEMREALRAPVLDPHVLTVYQRVLTLGFLGRYRDFDHPERQELVHALREKVLPWRIGPALGRQLVGRRLSDAFRWRGSPVLHGLLATMLLAGLWWGLDQHLSDLIASMAPVRGPL
ncbi:type VI secretion system protein TssL, short form [Pseudomonas sp. Pseu.R1]|uniref:type VI secretion system protein TssL, short form n=1 Tax=Pseudomonas sp. Pseu.R1 TaxID=3379818 RepID=UPI003B966828